LAVFYLVPLISRKSIFVQILGEQHGYNIPEVTNVPQLANWLTDEGVAYLNNCRDDKLLPEQAKRLLCDGYMCFYQSPGVNVIKTFFLVTDSLFDSALGKPFQSRA
jgi:hypothetical protein